MIKRFKAPAFLIILCFVLASCQAAPKKPVYIPPPKPKRGDVQHTVAPGETIWRISRIYDVPMGAILRANRISETTPIKMGQKLSIPGATKPEQPISLFPSNKWRYILIHHTATEHGSSLDFHKSHLGRGWDQGVGYHFIINNGTGEKPDGFVEVTPRWLKQLDGAHCRAADMNTKAIGISLVGNFSESRPTRAQMDALVDLTGKLKEYYNIPTSHVLGHGHVQGSNTECPGRNFSWEQFIKKLQMYR